MISQKAALVFHEIAGLFVYRLLGRAQLCLLAYAKWDERCSDRISGDFCFAIWDETRQTLLCVRDQLGVRPLFYTRAGSQWLIGDDLASVVPEPRMGCELDAFWIADFLTIGFSIDFERTVYRHIQRLPPAHVLVLSATREAVQKYWSLDIPQPVYFREPREYLAQFRELVSRAIADRMPSGRVGISLSGGLDSSTLAALAVKATGDPARVVAQTRYLSRLIPDNEDYFSALVANKLGIEHALLEADKAFLDWSWLEHTGQAPEPSLSVRNTERGKSIENEMLGSAKVWFYGEGPDNALTFEWRSYLRWLKNSRKWPELGHAAVQYFRSKKTREWLQSLRSVLPIANSKQSQFRMAVPPWLDGDLIKKVDIHRRVGRASGVSTHPWRPRAMASFNSPIWQHFFEQLDPVLAGTRLDWRHPYLDLRVLKFLLAVPPIPWGRRKLLMRQAMHGYLPAEILTRNKTPLQGEPFAAAFEETARPSLTPGQTILDFVDLARIPVNPGTPFEREALLRVYALDRWLGSHGYR